VFTEKIKLTIKDAAKKLTGIAKRAFVAQVTIAHFEGSTRYASRIMGWSRKTVGKGLKELETGIVCVDNYKARGRNKTEDQLPNLFDSIRSLIDGNSQTDPTFQSTLCYSRISAKRDRYALIREKGYVSSQLPTRQTIGYILNRLDGSDRKTQKAKPLKKFQKRMLFLIMFIKLTKLPMKILTP